MMIDGDHIKDDYTCKTCGKGLLIRGSIIPRNPLWYCVQCGNTGKLGEQFEAVK
jgi:ribosomal protein L37AE/L43A